MLCGNFFMQLNISVIAFLEVTIASSFAKKEIYVIQLFL